MATNAPSNIKGLTNAWELNIDSLRVGPVTKENFQVSVLESSTMSYPLLGQSFFGNYKYTVDTAAGVIHLLEQ